MNRIVTVTMNTCVDISTRIDKVTPDRKLRCSTLHYEPGGGAINVARVIHILGGEAFALYLAGGAFIFL